MIPSRPISSKICNPKSLFSHAYAGQKTLSARAARTAVAQRMRLSASTLTAVRSRLCQRTSDSDLIEARLQGAARRRLMRSHEREAAEARKPNRDHLPDLRADDLNYDHRDPAQVLLQLQALRRALHEAFSPGLTGAPTKAHA